MRISIVLFPLILIIFSLLKKDKPLPNIQPIASKMSEKIQKTCFVLGSTGATGKALVKELLNSSICSKVTAFARNKLTEKDFGIEENKKFESKVLDFDNLKEEDFKGYDAGFNAIGSTIKKAGSEEKFYKIDFTYPMTIAEYAKKHGTLYVST